MIVRVGRASDAGLGAAVRSDSRYRAITIVSCQDVQWRVDWSTIDISLQCLSMVVRLGRSMTGVFRGARI